MSSDRLSKNLELAAAIIMSLAALLTAWCGFQSSRWGSLQTVQLAEANLKNSAAMEKTLTNNQRFMTDGMLTLSFVDAVVEGKQGLVDFYVKRMRPELSQIMVKWYESRPLENPDAYPHPLALPEYSDLRAKYDAEAENLRKEATGSRVIALHADKVGDRYLVLTILFSSILFLGGIESKFGELRVKLMLLSLAVVLLLFSAYRLIGLPLATG